MKHCILLIALTLFLAACYGEPAPEANLSESEENPAPSGATEDVMENIEMYLWPSNAAPRQGQKPLLSIRARRFMGSVGSDKEWSFEDAEAVAPAQDAQQATISFKAARGIFQEDQRAVLQGGVTAFVNDMTVHLEDITWEISGAEGETTARGRAYSNNPITIDSPTQKLEASSMTLDPASATFELSDVSGEIHFGGIAP